MIDPRTEENIKVTSDEGRPPYITVGPNELGYVVGLLKRNQIQHKVIDSLAREQGKATFIAVDLQIDADIDLIQYLLDQDNI